MGLVLQVRMPLSSLWFDGDFPVVLEILGSSLTSDLFLYLKGVSTRPNAAHAGP